MLAPMRGRRLGELLRCGALWIGLAPSAAHAFAGVIVGKTNARREVHTAHVVLLQSGTVSVVTQMIDYAGPSEPFALIMPVPDDVKALEVRAVKREFMARLDQLSAPRFHAFFEQDPCSSEPVEQDWEVRYRAPAQGLLSPAFIPPPETNWTVPNDIAIRTEPVFKQSESEYRFSILKVTTAEALQRWLATKGYHANAGALASLLRTPELNTQLLVTEVDPRHVELLADGGLQLGAIRYVTHRPFTRISSTLGLAHSPGHQDLFVYVLHPTDRYEVANYKNSELPSNIEVDPAAAEHVAPLYNGLFDRRLATEPASVVTEYVWSTVGCGEPCPNAPLTLSELMTLGGDVVEARLVPAPARHPEPLTETEEEKQQFATQMVDKSASERAQAQRQHQVLRRELARRRALIERQQYVLTRLHYRYTPQSLQSDIELRPTSVAIEGGVGIPQGPKGQLPTRSHEAKRNHFQARFVSLLPFPNAIQCANPTRFRWGRRWKSLDTALRKVYLAEDLPNSRRDGEPFFTLIRTPLPDYGITPKPSVPDEPPPAATTTSAAMRGGSKCSLSLTPSAKSEHWLLAWLVACGCVLSRRRPPR